MRVLWISCLLMGIVSCVPVKKGGSQGGFSSPVWQPSSPGYRFTGSGTSSQKGGFPGASKTVSGGSWSPSGQTSYPEPVPAAPGWLGYYQAPAEETWISQSAEHDDEPVFSDVSDLEPVFSVRSRSRYQRGRAVFSQSRYTPTYSEDLAEPQFTQNIQTSGWSSPKAPVKGKY